MSTDLEVIPRFDPQRLARIAAILEERYVDSGKLPGFRLLLATSREIVLDCCAGFADIEREIPMARDTIFRIHSMTKPFTSLLLMMLVEEGAIGLDDPVHRILPPFRRLTMTPGGAPDGTGLVSIKTQPKGAQVAINRRVLDKTAPVDFYLNAGTYVVDITAAGYKNVQRVINVEKGGKLNIDETMSHE